MNDQRLILTILSYRNSIGNGNGKREKSPSLWRDQFGRSCDYNGNGNVIVMTMAIARAMARVKIENHRVFGETNLDDLAIVMAIAISL